MLSVGSIISGAFELPRREALALGIWSLLHVLSGIASWFVVQPAMVAIEQDATSPAAAFQYVGAMLLVQLAIFILFIIVLTATQRAMLRPSEGGLAFLRIGMDELRAVALALILGIAFYVALIILVLVIALMFGAAFSAGAGPASVIPLILVVLAVFALAIWLQVRLSLVFSLTFLRRKIIVGESWELTRGRFWTLFGGYLVIGLIMLALWLIVSLFTAAPYLSQLMQSGFDVAVMDGLAQDQLREITAFTVAGWLLGGILSALGVAVAGGATASVVRDLGVHQEDIASTFA